MANNWLIEQTIDLQHGVQAPLVWPNALMLCGDNNAHTWRVMIMDGGESAQITGNITGYFVRTDGNTVTVTGGLTGNVATVTLPQACYATDGDLYAVMRLKSSSGTITLSALILPVRNVLTDSIIDPGEVIPSLDDLLAQIDACEEATDAANDAADAANQAAQSASAVESDIEITEAARVTAEQGRVAAEQARASAEAARVANENERQQQLTNAINAAEADANRAEAAADAAETLIAMPPLFSDAPPTDTPTLNKLWVDTGVSPTMMRRWRGADVPTEREYTETRVGCGKNLLKPSGDATVSGVTYTLQDNGTYLANGTVAGTGLLTMYKGVLPPGQYTISGGVGGIQVSLSVHKSDGTYIRTICVSRNGASATGTVTELTGEEAYHQAFIQAASTIVGQTVTNVVLSPQLEAGDTATAFEAYEDVPLLALDNAQGQIESVAVEAGCRAKQAGTGEPSSENIRAITGRDSVEIAACGKNLLPVRSDSVTSQGITYTSNGGGSYTVNGTATTVNAYDIWKHAPLNGTYTLSGGQDGVMFILSVNDENGWVSNVAISQNGGYVTTTVTSLPDGQYYRLLLQVNPNVTVNNVRVFPQIERSDTFTGYEPYRPMGGGAVAPTEPLYGLPGAEDTVEVSVDGDVTVTRRTGVFIADGDQYAPYASAFAAPEGVYAYTAPLTGSGAAHKENFAGMCSHFTVIPRNAVQSECVAGTVMLGIPNSGDGPQAWFFTTQATAEAFNAWLQQQDSAGTPVTLVYELAAPETEALTAISPIAPEKGQLNISTDADALSATVHGSGWDTISDQTGLLATIAQLTARVAALEQVAINESTGG